MQINNETVWSQVLKDRLDLFVCSVLSCQTLHGLEQMKYDMLCVCCTVVKIPRGSAYKDMCWKVQDEVLTVRAGECTVCLHTHIQYTHAYTNNMDHMGGKYWASSKSYLRKIISWKEKMNTDKKKNKASREKHRKPGSTADHIKAIGLIFCPSCRGSQGAAAVAG